MARHCPDCAAEMQDDGVHAWCVALGCEFRGYVVMRTGKILRGTDWECPECSKLNYGSECGECGFEFFESADNK